MGNYERYSMYWKYSLHNLIHPIIELLYYISVSGLSYQMCLPECPMSSSNKISVTSILLQVVFLNKMVTEYTIPVQCMDPMETYSLHTGRYIIYKLDTVCEVSMRL